jgi:hypothetical protein
MHPAVEPIVPLRLDAQDRFASPRLRTGTRLFIGTRTRSPALVSAQIATNVSYPLRVKASAPLRIGAVPRLLKNFGEFDLHRWASE